MSAKEIVKKFYKSDAFINFKIMDEYLHPDFMLDWNSSQGFLQVNRKELLELTTQMGKAYTRSKIRISKMVAEKDVVSVRYSHYIKTIENPREEMLLAHIMIIWELKDNKLYRGYQMSQISD